MTENKRFRFYQDIEEVMYIEDMQGENIQLAHEEDMKPENAIKVVDLLNDLNEENEQLKQLNIPIGEIKDMVIDYQGRVVGVYYND